MRYTQSGWSSFAFGTATLYRLTQNIFQAAYQIAIVFWCLLPKRDKEQFMNEFYGPNLV